MTWQRICRGMRWPEITFCPASCGRPGRRGFGRSPDRVYRQINWYNYHMSKTEIMAELAHLSPDDLAEVRAWLERQALDKTSASARPSPRIRSPRLANPAQ